MSMRYWSGTSTARLGTNRAASIASTSSTPQTTSGRAPTRAPAPVRTKSATPATIQTRSTSPARRSRALATAGRHRRDQRRRRPRSSAASRAREPRRWRTLRPHRTPGPRPRGERRAHRGAVRRAARCPRGRARPRRARSRRCGRRTSRTARRPRPRPRTTPRRTTRARPAASVRLRCRGPRCPRLPRRARRSGRDEHRTRWRGRPPTRALPGSRLASAAGVQRRHEREPALRGVLARDVLSRGARGHEQVDDACLAVHGDRERARDRDASVAVRTTTAPPEMGRDGCRRTIVARRGTSLRCRRTAGSGGRRRR